jgi:hypothetical protein
MAREEEEVRVARELVSRTTPPGRSTAAAASPPYMIAETGPTASLKKVTMVSDARVKTHHQEE